MAEFNLVLAARAGSPPLQLRVALISSFEWFIFQRHLNALSDLQYLHEHIFFVPFLFFNLVCILVWFSSSSSAYGFSLNSNFFLFLSIIILPLLPLVGDYELSQLPWSLLFCGGRLLVANDEEKKKSKSIITANIALAHFSSSDCVWVVNSQSPNMRSTIGICQPSFRLELCYVDFTYSLNNCSNYSPSHLFSLISLSNLPAPWRPVGSISSSVYFLALGLQSSKICRWPLDYSRTVKTKLYRHTVK